MDRPLGRKVPGWTAALRPENLTLRGQWAELTPLNPDSDADPLFDAFAGADWVWDYLYEPPPADRTAFRAIMELGVSRTNQPCFVIRAKNQPNPLGYACFWTVVPDMGNIEIGNVNLSPALQQTPAATETFFLMIDWAFANGYRRIEWKCNALNAPSRRAAQRLGFSFEGVFRNHLIVKGHNRDTAWFSITDADWIGLRDTYETWLNPQNFDTKGRQKISLATLTLPHVAQCDPAQVKASSDRS